MGQTVTRLLNEIPGIRIAVFAHGDYQDKEDTYDTTWVDFSSDKKKICDFITNVSSTCGYDSDECYELVLRQVRGVPLSLSQLQRVDLGLTVVILYVIVKIAFITARIIASLDFNSYPQFNI